MISSASLSSGKCGVGGRGTFQVLRSTFEGTLISVIGCAPRCHLQLSPVENSTAVAASNLSLSRLLHLTHYLTPGSLLIGSTSDSPRSACCMCSRSLAHLSSNAGRRIGIFCMVSESLDPHDFLFLLTDVSLSLLTTSSVLKGL